MKKNITRITRIVIEGHDEEQMQKFFIEIQNNYSLYDNCVIETNVSPEETIIDKHRYSETGGLKINKTLVRKYGE